MFLFLTMPQTNKQTKTAKVKKKKKGCCWRVKSVSVEWRMVWKESGNIPSKPSRLMYFKKNTNMLSDKRAQMMTLDLFIFWNMSHFNRDKCVFGVITHKLDQFCPFSIIDILESITLKWGQRWAAAAWILLFTSALMLTFGLWMLAHTPGTLAWGDNTDLLWQACSW